MNNSASPFKSNLINVLQNKNLSKTYPILMESPITRQFVFPGVAFNGGPGLQIRPAGITARWSGLLITELTGTITNIQNNKDKKKAILVS